MHISLYLPGFNSKQKNSAQTQFLTAIKSWESTLLPSTGEVRFRQHNVVRYPIEFQHLSEVVCPHSMFCVPFILNMSLHIFLLITLCTPIWVLMCTLIPVRRPLTQLIMRF